MALDHFSLDVWEGGVVTLLGPSGCGKTTALRVIAGFEDAVGTVEIHGRTVLGADVFVPPEKRRVGMVFQDYALFPHMTVERNVAYGLPRGDRGSRVGEVLELVGLTGLEDRMPNELSGGQQQRVALARALAARPGLLLADEPTGQLDSETGREIMVLIARLAKEESMTTVVTTHDPVLLSIADRVVEIVDGHLVGSS